MNHPSASTLDAVRDVVVQALELDVHPSELTAQTIMFGAMPELDSLGVVALVAALEDHFGILVEDSEFGEDIFETVGTLTEFVDQHLPE